MGLWVELGVFVLALAFGLWQIQDVKKAREATRRQRAQAQEPSQAQTGEGKPSPDVRAADPAGTQASGLSDRR